MGLGDSSGSRDLRLRPARILAQPAASVADSTEKAMVARIKFQDGVADLSLEKKG